MCRILIEDDRMWTSEEVLERSHRAETPPRQDLDSRTCRHVIVITI